MTAWLILAGALLAGYLFGSVPAGFLVAKAHRVDIRQEGSGNIGATNVYRMISPRAGIFVFVCDFLKGLLPVCLATGLAPRLGGDEVSWVTPAVAGIVAGLGSILGHNFTFWLGFKGGKGIATSAGVLIGLVPLAVPVALLVWWIVFSTSRYVSLASMAAAAALPVAVYLLVRFTGTMEWTLFYFSLVVAALAIWRHRSNIERLRKGTESRIERRRS